MACLRCSAKQGNSLEIIRSSVKANSQVKAGENYEISLDVKNVYWSPISTVSGRVCLYEGNNVLAQSGSFKVSGRGTQSITFTGRMPNNDLNLKISVVEEQIAILQFCQDAVDIFIPLGTVTEKPTKQETDDEDEWWEDLSEFFKDNKYILIGAFVLIIVAVIMRRR